MYNRVPGSFKKQAIDRSKKITIMCPNRLPNYLCAKNDASLSYSFSLVPAAQPEGKIQSFDCSMLWPT
jgi:hypothetical protein